MERRADRVGGQQPFELCDTWSPAWGVGQTLLPRKCAYPSTFCCNPGGAFHGSADLGPPAALFPWQGGGEHDGIPLNSESAFSCKIPQSEKLLPMPCLVGSGLSVGEIPPSTATGLIAHSTKTQSSSPFFSTLQTSPKADVERRFSIEGTGAETIF